MPLRVGASIPLLLTLARCIADRRGVGSAPSGNSARTIRQVNLKVLWHVLNVDHGTIDDMSRDAVGVANECLSDDGLDSVATNDSVGLIALTMLVDDDNT
ncbi:hypothetical protein OKW35_004629 [Paraburkholderia sp. MM5477-R1]